jgi:hypothetical protein
MVSQQLMDDDERIGGKDRRFLRRCKSGVCYLTDGNFAAESFGPRPWIFRLSPPRDNSRMVANRTLRIGPISRFR